LPPTLEDRLNDIQTAIEPIESLLAGVSREEFEKDWIRRLAAERLLEILSEASRHIPRAVKDSVDVPWRDIADFGNLLRHAYHRVDPDMLWNICGDDLKSLKAAIERLMSKS
jgi:uncharacterized protein with HEPN domain